MPKTASPSEGSPKEGRVGEIFNYITMKKLGELKLTEEKMLSHEELVSFKGGCSGTVWVCASYVDDVLRDCANNCSDNCDDVDFEWINYC